MTPFLLFAATPAPEVKTPAIEQPIAQVAAAPATADGKAGKYPYFSLQLGAGIPNSLSGSDDITPFDTTLENNVGFNGEAAIGYKVNDFRFDVSVVYGNFGVAQQQFTDSTGTTTIPGDGSISLWAAMANAYWDIPVWEETNVRSRWNPYIGLGIGYANLSTPPCPAGACYSGGSGGSLAWQAKLGVSYRATQSGSLFLEGGYLGTTDNITVDSVTFGSFGTWRVNLGWRQRFGG